MLNAEAGETLAVFVPVSIKNKQPITCHKGGQWSHDKALQWLKHKAQKAQFRVGMLLYGLVVIDFDRAELYPAWAAEFPELEAVPAERTRKGMHCYFLRCHAAQAAGLTDGPLNDPATGLTASMDVKTVTGSEVNGHTTGSLIVCAPTPNYAWLEGRSLLELGVKPMTPALLAKVLAWRRAGVKESNKGCGGSKRPRRANQPQPAGAQPSSQETAPRLEPTVSFASKADLMDLLGLLGLRTDIYSEIGRFEGPSPGSTRLECLSLRPDKDRDNACAVCNAVHKDSLVGTIWLSSASCYELKVKHRRNKACQVRYMISKAKQMAFARRIEEGARVPAEEAVGVVQLLAATGSLTPANPSTAVWPLPDPAPGVKAHAIRVGDASWRLLMSLGQPNGPPVAWSRSTRLPGLKYELLRPHGDWACSVQGRGAMRPEFWPAPFSAADDIE